MNKINITCEHCHIIHEVDRTSEIPKHVIALYCNWCPNCEDDAESNWEEWYNNDDEDDDNNFNELPPPNQLDLFPLYIGKEYGDSIHFKPNHSHSKQRSI